MLPGIIKWLRRVGHLNREMLEHVYFYDGNEEWDRQSPRELEKLKGSEIFTEMAGYLTTMSGRDCCAHLITFGAKQRDDGVVSLALQDGARRLRLGTEQLNY